METPKEIFELVERFDRNREAYQSGQYNETQARHEFIDPFFIALGWDVNNRQGYAEAYKDVIHEDAIKVGRATQAPDYCFRIGGTRKFFLEAKKPSVDIKGNPDPAFQLHRYAWSAKLPLSILTDFEEFTVYDCRIKPDKSDNAATARTLYLRYTDYAERWDEIASIFSQDAVLKGSFDKYVESSRLKKGTAEVDDAFLKEIETWREMLARNLALRNPALTQRDLNFAIGRIIDRIIFLRICEDRGIEEYGRLMALLNGSEIYRRLSELFRRADERYNSGLFHFRKEKDRPEPPDDLTLGLTLDDKPLKEIIRDLYYPDSPYEFSVLPADILGQVYEQFLGKVIRLTAGHRAVVEDKPEVKKAGGVYYTPTYIVDYIVKNTVGKLVEGKTAKQVAKLRILDPACGSGSFLIGAYQYLLDWHREQYTNDGSEKHRKELYQSSGGEWRLTTAEKKRILLNNIYGVDIDPQAVEVTKLSLLLKVLEGESDQTLATQLRLFHERALPDLGNNIKCGNSLIGPEFYENRQMSLFDEEERYRINVFDWQAEFPDVMKAGGFDAVIGNPPYIRIQMMKEWAPVEVELYKTLYQSAAAGNYDIYVVFVEKGVQLLNKTGRLGFILPHKFFNARYGEALREVIAKGKHLAHVVHFGDQQVFTGATTYTCLLFLDKAGSSECSFVKVGNLDAWRMESQCIKGTITAKSITAAAWNFTVGASAELFGKLSKWPVKLPDIAERIAQGIRTSANEVYVLDLVREKANVITADSKMLGRNVELERKVVSLFLQGREIKPYNVLPSGKVVILPYTIQNGRMKLIPEVEIQNSFPLLYDYLTANKEYLAAREQGRNRGPNWYAYIYPKYILALLNSSLLDFYLKRISTTMRGGFFRYFAQFIGQLPICQLDFTNRSDKARHDRMVKFVEQMLTLHKQLASTKTPDDKTRLQRQIQATDKQIDVLVYELYGLTEEEIKIVEEDTDSNQ
jgi:hypothetical protein